ncbi:EPIDERMAL PATTERNING FACTOR-like protein 9 [Pyrus ussuriensis x Pyrus communis]|uniref:EPIDERMAL PATTERNING FACTOR-like protein 9 n=1 Tax=Pyrus ussuriensis x Pyrus communis TaxID=2448454 RepID=A0A5N5I2A6_9ROSA|nr:EPIDERMAL PATTERNING FACTOR-like protein 9 [Pyrus ussuriensis x Pyrus communis]KAB2634985.1 EPIDERMAL PATTERNING FACTOR-like protein 9 [Pyrus ussuriensis x Pyrus communis]
MAKSTRPILLLPFFIILVFAAMLTQVAELPHSQRVNDFSTSQGEQLKQQGKDELVRRLMIGSTAPTCTYNECRGCKYKCRAEQVPVEGNDPINSAYHYRCVCHG